MQPDKIRVPQNMKMMMMIVYMMRLSCKVIAALQNEAVKKIYLEYLAAGQD